MNWDEAKIIIKKDNEVQTELINNEMEYRIIEAIIEARKEHNLSQDDLAKRIGTSRSNITKLENGNYKPSIDFLNRVAKAIGKELQIRIV